MEITCNPGKGNSFFDFEIHKVENLNPNAKTVHNHYYGSGYGNDDGKGSSRLASYFRGLHREIASKLTRELIDELLEYKTKLDGTKGLEGKLTDGGFSPSAIESAMRKKEKYAKKATKYECYPSAQEINLLLFADIKNRFELYIYPLIEAETDKDLVMQRIHEQIVEPIMRLINENGADDADLRYTSDHIYGMIYYLTGMCHLNWKDYDNV